MEEAKVMVGNTVEIELGDVIASKTYVSKVAKISNQNELILEMPRSFGHKVELPLGNYYVFIIFTDDGMIKFSGKIVEYKKVMLPESDDYFAIVDLTSNGEKIQRREDFRFTCEIPMQFHRINSMGDVLRDEGSIGHVIDLSGGGIKFLSSYKLEPKTRIQITITLGSELLFLDADVLYVDEITHPDYDLQYRCRFVNLMDSDKDKIIQFVFDAQRVNLRRSRKRF